ncbi:hypothetical protein S83_070365 [Arachis hypogaea]|uniref:DDE Tnp4 domain-containing protein n=1 Tax=Arachis hypogaea TaxID=3818 RepID=A0A444X3K4_ARAHY|nr:uncharacterized protein DS421_20g695130 [Arachis hypogaea]RYQ84237.1 hypothetical protein Ahy_B10g103334 [Arachis hypogaea]
MEPRKFAAILSSLISQLILLLLLILPSNSSHSFFNSNSTLIVHHVLLSHQIAASLSSSTRRNKKRPRTDPDPGPDRFIYSEPRLICPMLQNEILHVRVARRPPRATPRLQGPSAAQPHRWLPPRHRPLPPRQRIGLPRNIYPVRGSGFRRKVLREAALQGSLHQFPVLDLVPESERARFGFARIRRPHRSPHCCGVLHYTRFEVVSPRDPPSPPSPVAAQLVVDSSCRILSVAAGFFGRKSNSRILKSSLFQDIEEGTLLNSPPVKAMNNGVEVDVKQYLVGGGEGYPLLPWLMVPFAAEEAAAGSNEESFNVAIDVTKIPAIRTAASLRNWGVLDGPVLEEVKVAVAYIGACSILHNGLLMREDFSALAGEMEGYQLQQQRYREFCRLDLENDDSITEKALVIRSTLVTMVKKNS